MNHQQQALPAFGEVAQHGAQQRPLSEIETALGLFGDGQQLRGIGRLAVQAIQNRDFPLVQGVVLLAALTFVVVNLLIDLLYLVLNPRIRL